MKLVRILWTVVLVTALSAIFGCGPSAPPEDAEKTEEAEPQGSVAPPAEEPAAEEMAKVEPPAPKAEPEPAKAPKAEPKKKVSGKPVVVMETSKGAIKIELDAEKAPGTVDNFLKYVDAKFYDGTIFHRVMPNFMIQGGGFTPGMNEKSTRPEIKNEAGNGLSNSRGTIAMARRGDPHSASAQFYINHKDNPGLDKENARDGWGYAVFGKVIEGTDVVDAIAAVLTTNKNGHGNVPVEPVMIKSVRRAS